MKTATENERKFNVRLGQTLQTIRSRKAIRQNEVAKAIETSVNHVSEIERGLARPTAYELGKFCEAIGADPSAVMGFDRKDSYLEDRILRQIKALSEDEKQIVFRMVKGLTNIE